VLLVTEEQLAANRLYKSKQVVQILDIEPTWLKRWITAERVPHLRSGAQRGVRFTAAHILEIGTMLPELLGGHRGGAAADDRQAGEAVQEEPRPCADDRRSGGSKRRTPSEAMPTVADLAAWAQLRAHLLRSRST
jgi:hypothetical protein